jgi:hypothetical protein
MSFKNYCGNLQEISLKKISEMPDYDGFPVIGNPISYHCLLTKKQCVGAEDGIFIWSNDKFSLEIIEKCPSKKIENIVNE